MSDDLLTTDVYSPTICEPYIIDRFHELIWEKGYKSRWRNFLLAPFRKWYTTSLGTTITNSTFILLIAGRTSTPATEMCELIAANWARFFDNRTLYMIQCKNIHSTMGRGGVTVSADFRYQQQ